MDTLTILLALATVGYPGLDRGCGCHHSPVRGNGRGRAAHIPRKSLAQKSWRICGVCRVSKSTKMVADRYTVVIGLGGMLVALATLITAEAADAAGCLPEASSRAHSL